MRFKRLVLLGGLICLAACENQNGVTAVATEPDVVTVKLAQAADKASKALDNIAGIEQMRSPAAPPVEDYSNVPPNLIQPVSIRWSGPIEQIAKVLAEQAGYRFRVKGNVPPVPLTVNVDVYQQPIVHVLRDIGLQAGHRADLAIDGSNGFVEVRYAAADQSVSQQPFMSPATMSSSMAPPSLSPPLSPSPPSPPSGSYLHAPR